MTGYAMRSGEIEEPIQEGAARTNLRIQISEIDIEDRQIRRLKGLRMRAILHLSLIVWPRLTRWRLVKAIGSATLIILLLPCLRSWKYEQKKQANPGVERRSSIRV
jgi:hypothetical protein